ncbi:hypothetical protein ACFVHQ_11230 [Actinomycetes bacterium NPDC127524]
MKSMINDYEWMELYKLQRQELERKARMAGERAERLNAAKVNGLRKETINLRENQICLDCE